MGRQLNTGGGGPAAKPQVQVAAVHGNALMSVAGSDARTHQPIRRPYVKQCPPLRPPALAVKTGRIGAAVN